MLLIFLEGFLFAYVPLGRMVKFLFFAQFSVDHLSYPVVRSIELLLCYFIAFAYNAIKKDHY